MKMDKKKLRKLPAGKMYKEVMSSTMPAMEKRDLIIDELIRKVSYLEKKVKNMENS